MEDFEYVLDRVFPGGIKSRGFHDYYLEQYAHMDEGSLETVRRIQRDASDRLAEATENTIRSAMLEYPETPRSHWRILLPAPGQARQLQVWALDGWHTVRELPELEITESPRPPAGGVSA